ncbi:MAG: DnaD domain protein [Ruminococcus sp.]|nr:DnaD domain protein [Ruminococcus sp.]
MSIKINLGAWNSIFAVPSAVVDEGLKFSDGVKLKVLLYLLRYSGEDMDENQISKATGVNVSDIPEAIEYWVSRGIFKKTNDEFVPIEKEQQISEKVTVQAEKFEPVTSEIKESDPETKTPVVTMKPRRPDYVFVAQQLAVDEEFKILVNEAQTALGKTLSNSDAASLLMLKNTCGLPIDVIIMLIQYCLSINKANVRAIETLGIKWSDEGIFSIEAAENKIMLARRSSMNFSIVSAAFGLKNIGSPTKKQMEYADVWVGEWKFSSEMLREAYERCVDSKGTADFRYINGILKRWNTNGIFNKADLEKSELAGKQNDKKEKSTSSFNISDLEKFNYINKI